MTKKSLFLIGVMVCLAGFAFAYLPVIVGAAPAQVHAEAWIITVRGGDSYVYLECNGQEIAREQLNSSLRGWHFYQWDWVAPDTCSSLTIGFDTVFPDNSLGWKFKGVVLSVNGGVNLLANPCFDGSLSGWDNPTGYYSLSVDGGQKNVIPGVCDGGGFAAKHGPTRTNGNGIVGVRAQLSQTVSVAITPIPSPTGTPIPSPTGTPIPSPTPYTINMSIGDRAYIQCDGTLIVIGNFAECNERSATSK